MDKKLLAILACPICKGKIHFNQESQELVCYADALAFPIRDEIPVMLENDARPITAEEKENRPR